MFENVVILVVVLVNDYSGSELRQTNTAQGEL